MGAALQLAAAGTAQRAAHPRSSGDGARANGAIPGGLRAGLYGVRKGLWDRGMGLTDGYGAPGRSAGRGATALSARRGRRWQNAEGFSATLGCGPAAGLPALACGPLANDAVRAGVVFFPFGCQFGVTRW